jgi:hypothetical protein
VGVGVNAPGPIALFVLIPALVVFVVVYGWPTLRGVSGWSAADLVDAADEQAWDEHCAAACAAGNDEPIPYRLIDPFVSSPPVLPLTLDDRMWLIQKGVSA